MLRLDVSDLSVRYGNHKILDGVCAGFKGGEMAAVIGKNGVGKTTFIKAIAKLVKSSGRINIRDGEAECGDGCIAYVPQMGVSGARLSVFEMVLLGLVKDLRWKVSDAHIKKAGAVLELLGLSHLAEKAFNELSGGERQLIFLAQSFVSRPKVLLLDEPTSALDMRHQIIVMDQVLRYTRDTGAVTIFIVHDLSLAARYGDTMLLLDDAKIMTQGAPHEVLKPELLEGVYGVTVHVEKNSLGQYGIVPQAPLALSS